MEKIEIKLKEKKMKSILNIDRLEISFTADEKTTLQLSLGITYNGQFYTIQNITDDNNKVLYHEVILSNGELLGKVIFGANYFNKERIYFIVDNKVLYSNYLPFVNDVVSLLNLEFHSISRLDLAIDTNKNIIKNFYKIIKDEQLKLKILNHIYDIDDDISSLLHISTGSRKNIRKYKSFYINNSDNNLTLNCYDKMKEIHDNNNKKYYIAETINTSKIYRLEIRAHHNSLIDTLKEIGFTDSYLYDILLTKNADELYIVFLHLLDRIIQVNYKRKSYPILDFILYE